MALDCAQEAAGQLRFEIEAAFSQGLPNTPMANATCAWSRAISSRPARSASWTAWTSSTSGLVRRVDAAAIQRAIDTGAMVLLSPFGFRPPARPST